MSPPGAVPLCRELLWLVVYRCPWMFRVVQYSTKLPSNFTRHMKLMFCRCNFYPMSVPLSVRLSQIATDFVDEVSGKAYKHIWHTQCSLGCLTNRVIINSLNHHSFVRNRFLIIYYAACFKEKILLDHFGSQNNSQNIPLKHLMYSEK